jgi:hypothetical protein
MMTETQIKIARLMIASMVGMSIYQSFVIRRLTTQLNYGRNQFNKLHSASLYLLEIINESDIELTEFDLIALTAISEGK